MKESYNSHINYSGSLIAKNTIYNLLGYGIPLVFAIILIPPLIKGLGEERFGILNLAWIIIGYFSFLDFGIGRAVTKIIAEKIGINKLDEIAPIFWTSFFLMLFVSLIGALFTFLLTPVLVNDFLKISEELQTESLNTFYLLAISIPIVTTTAGLRGVLEAYQKFGIINIIRTLLGVFSFLGPLICLAFTESLFWIVLLLIIIRIIVWLLYLFQCFKLNVRTKRKLLFEPGLIKPILKLSGWITVSNMIVPLIIYLDRFLIGAIVSATAITYYATPYEVISKLLLIPGALTGVLFPAFSANYARNPEFAKKLSLRAVKYTFLILFPIILIIITFAYEGMYLWLGEKFAANSSFILQLLALGTLFNSMAYIPFSFLQGIGRPDVTAKLQILELPFYLAAMWYGITNYGIEGAALVWMLRMIIDTLLLFWLNEKISGGKNQFQLKIHHIFMGLLIAFSIIPAFMMGTTYKVILIIVILTLFIIMFWKKFLDIEEKKFVLSKIKI